MSELSAVQRRVMNTSADIALSPPQEIAFQHSVLCQTCLPYRNPGPGVRSWDREQGAVALRVSAGDARNPATGKWVELGLPFGPKPRLILAHLNAEVLKQGSPVIEVEASLTAFVRRIQQRPPTGPEIRVFKDQLARLAAATIRLAILREGHAITIKSDIIQAFDLWLQKDEHQRVLWPSTIRLSADYYASLLNHAVPLDERALAALAHNAMALDVYAWLAQRLHRIAAGKPQRVSWVALKEQFGQGYGRMNNFKAKLLAALRLVHTQYPLAHVEADRRGLELKHSLPPVPPRFIAVHKPVDI